MTAPANSWYVFAYGVTGTGFRLGYGDGESGTAMFATQAEAEAAARRANLYLTSHCQAFEFWKRAEVLISLSQFLANHGWDKSP